MLVGESYSDQELYRRLRKYLPRSMAGDSYASELINRLFEVAQKQNPEVYYNALDDSLSDISRNDTSILGDSLDTFVRARYSPFNELDDFFELYKTDYTPARENYAFDEFCRINDLKPDDIMLFPIVGNSMINANINEGDTAIVDTSKIPVNGDIGAVFVNNKYFIKRIGGVGGRLKLISENPEFKPYIIGPKDDFKYIGLVTNIIKRM
jgi:hypothetical protein